MDSRATLPPTPQKTYDRLLLERVNPLLCLTMFAQNRSLKRGEGDTISFRRFGALSSATTPLTEGVTPAPSSLSRTEITATVQPYGNYVVITDMLDLTDIDPVVVEATDVLGENGGQTVEEIVRSEVLNGTNVLYPVGRTARSQIQAGDVLTAARVRRGIAILQNGNANPAKGERGSQGMAGSWMGWIHPFVFDNLFGDTTVLQTVSYSDPNKLWDYSLPKLLGVMWYVSSKAPFFVGAGNTGSVDVYCTFIFGREAFGVVDTAGFQGTVPPSGKLGTIVKTPGQHDTSDPLNQRSTVGWKSIQAPKILNNAFMIRLESTVAA